MDQFDDFEVEEPQQSQQPVSTPDSTYAQVQNPTYNVVNNPQNPAETVVNNAVETAAPITYTQSTDQRRIPCPKCGQPIIEGSRYCMHCGELDFDNDKNQSVKKAFFQGKKLKAREEKRKRMFEKKNRKMYSLDSNGISRQEKIYTGIKKTFSFFFFVGIVVAAINYKSIILAFNNFRKDFYIKQVQTIVDDVSDMYDSSKCRGTVFYFSDAADYFKVFASPFTFQQLYGYVEVVSENGEYHYIVTVYDSKYGINRVDSKDITRDSVKKMDEPDLITDTFSCD